MDRRDKQVMWKAGLNRLRTFLAEESGPTATEYAALLAGIILVCVGAIGTVGTKVAQMFTDVEAAF